MKYNMIPFYINLKYTYRKLQYTLHKNIHKGKRTNHNRSVIYGGAVNE